MPGVMLDDCVADSFFSGGPHYHPHLQPLRRFTALAHLEAERPAAMHQGLQQQLSSALQRMEQMPSLASAEVAASFHDHEVENAMLSLGERSPTDAAEEWSAASDVYACDEFRMFEFKVRRCMRGRSHDWTECPFAHPGEKARRRDPRRYHYSGTACPDFRKGTCRRGDACEYAHGVFECWLHPARYRTQPCKDGRACRRRVCFFAHTPEQLRLLPAAAAAASSPTSCSHHQATSPVSPLTRYTHSPPPLSPPLSPPMSPPRLNSPPMASSPSVFSSGSSHYQWSVNSSSTVTLPTSPQPIRQPPNHAPQQLERHFSLPPRLTLPVHLQQAAVAAALAASGSPSAGKSNRSAAESANRMAEALAASLSRLEVTQATRGSSWMTQQPSTPSYHHQQQQCVHMPPRRSVSVPCTPDAAGHFPLWQDEMGAVPAQRVESGRDLRAKFYGRVNLDNQGEEWGQGWGQTGFSERAEPDAASWVDRWAQGNLE